MIGNSLDLVSGFEDPTLAPRVYDSIVIGRGGDKGERNFENDRIDIYAGLAVSTAVDETEVAVGVFVKLVTFPGERAGRKFAFVVVVSPLRIVWIEVEQVIAFEFEQCLWNL